MARSWRWFAGFLILSAAIVPVAPADAGQPPAARIEISFLSGPLVPFEPFTAELTVTGCEPGVDVLIELVRLNAFNLNPERRTMVTADAQGEAVTAFDAVAYPGDWRYNASCGETGDGNEFDVATPEDFRASADQTTLTFDVATTVTVVGAGCPGQQAAWELAAQPIAPWGSARADVAEDGTWSAAAPVLIPSDDADLFDEGQASVLTYCEMSTDEGVVRVFYPVLSLRLDPAPATTGGPDETGAEAVAPRFTG